MYSGNGVARAGVEGTSAHVGLRLAKPHGEELGALDGDEVGLALVGDGLCEEGLAASRGAVEEHALGSVHTKELKLVGVPDA